MTLLLVVRQVLGFAVGVMLWQDSLFCVRSSRGSCYDFQQSAVQSTGMFCDEARGCTIKMCSLARLWRKNNLSRPCA